MQCCTQLGVPLAMHKTMNLTPCLTFLGIVINIVVNQLRLPEDKLARLRELLTTWGDRKAYTRRELESLTGTLNHACKAVLPGRSFLRRMLNLLKSPHAQNTRKRPTQQIRLNRDFRSDLQWWRVFAERWNGTAISTLEQENPHSQLTSDASGKWGCGSWSGTSWFQLKWDSISQDFTICVKELIPIVVATVIWGERWRGRRVLCRCDNQAVVAALNSRSCRENHIMHMLRCLFFFEAQFDSDLHAVYISSQDNYRADALSRDNVSVFYSKMPQTDPTPAVIPPALPPLLFDQDVDWLSSTWTRQCQSILSKA